MQQPIEIVAIPAFEDNYIWLLHNGHDAIVIDPGDSAPVFATLKAHNLKLAAILITHYHADHIGGVPKLKEHYSIPVYAPIYEQFAFQHIAVREGDHIHLHELNLSFSVLWLPGHTLGHIAFFNQAYLFCGDVLFGAGCGRLFEGTPEQMLHSLNRLKNLQTSTKVYCTHEYTCKNIDFALTLDPNNQALIDRKQSATQLRKENKATLPTTIELELNTNPFLRCNEPSIRQHANAVDTDELSVFSKIRTLRNHY